MDQAFAEFLESYPEYSGTEILDALRASDFARLDAGGHVYIDYTGASLYAESHVREHAALLEQHVFGNPHSGSLCSEATTTQLVERTRRRVLEDFNASPDDYTAIFTLNATSAVKLVGESYPFEPGGRCLLTFDNHNSVNGVREFAQLKGAAVDYAPLTTPDLGIDRVQMDRLLDRAKGSVGHLLAFPAQSNFSGVRHSLDLIDRAQRRGWHVLLDAAALVPTTGLDLTSVQPDFVAVSFYKMFGYPTGVGCLLARRTALTQLRRPWFAGGTINFATVQGRAHVLAAGEAGFEDGTLNYLSIPAVEIGLRMMDRVGIRTIHTRVRCLTAWLLNKLLALQHGNGRPMVRIYGPVTTEARGGAVTLNLYDPEGHLVDYRRVEELASAERISFRTGASATRARGEAAEELTEDDMLAGLEESPDITLPRFLRIIQYRSGKSAGAIRVSFGLASNFPDAYRVLQFFAGLRDQTRLTIGDVSFDIQSCRVMRDGS